MRHKYIHKKKNVLYKAKKVLVLIVLAFLAVQAGMAGGSWLAGNDLKLIQSMDTEKYKFLLNSSFPVIDMVYNGGKKGGYFLGEIQGLIQKVFMFDLDSPLTVLNAQSSYFNRYYYKQYKPMMDKKLAAADEEGNPYPSGIDLPGNPSDSHDPLYQEGESSTEYIGGEPEDNTAPDTPDDGTPPKVTTPNTGTTTPNTHVVKDQIFRYDQLWVANETELKVTAADVDKMLKEPLDFSFPKSGSKVLIYHTHTTESYIPNLDSLKTTKKMYSTNSKQNMLRVGQELHDNLEKLGISTIQNDIVHNPNGNNGAYGRSLQTARTILNGNSSLRLVFDVHRDGIYGKKLRTATKINGKSAAKIMFVVGSAAKYEHPNWRKNLKLAMKLQERLHVIAPDIVRYTIISPDRYNQHLSKGAVLIEVGGEGDLMSECLESTKYLAQAINDVMKGK